MVKQSAITKCCTAKLIHSFPHDYVWNFYKKDIKEVISKKLSRLKRDGFVIVIVLLTSHQKKSISLLKSMGFSCSRPVKKKVRHLESNLYLLSIFLDTKEY